MPFVMNMPQKGAKLDSARRIESRDLNFIHLMSLLLTLGMIGGEEFALAGVSSPTPKPVVEAEDDVYSYENANNGAGPLWCQGSTCLVRIGRDVYASGLETIKNAKPLNNCRWKLFRRDQHVWAIQQSDTNGRTREPSPMGGFPSGHLFLTANPSLTAPDTYSGAAQPEILEFAAADTKAAFSRLLPVWEGTPRFTEHSYRSFAVDGPGRELFPNFDPLGQGLSILSPRLRGASSYRLSSRLD
jgi:hypothetical protein